MSNVPMELFDTHCHLYTCPQFEEVGTVVSEANAAGVKTLVCIGIDPETSRQAIDLAERFEGVYATVGHHPNQAADFTAETLVSLKEMARHPRVVALGEMGLDYHWDFATKEQQYACLEAQLEWACEVQKPVVFHSRESTEDLLDVVAALENRPRMVLHCFGGTLDQARRALDLGLWLGFDGPITYPKSVESSEVLAMCPRDRVLIETDAPYLAPVPFRGKTNFPGYLPMINERVAEIWGVSSIESATITTKNARHFYGLD